MKSIYKYIIGVLLVIVSICQVAYGYASQQIIIDERPPGHRLTRLPPEVLAEADAKFKQELVSYYNWMQGPWPGDDRVYASIRQDIDSQVASGVSPQTIRDKWQKAFDSQPTNSQTLFGLCYIIRIYDRGDFPAKGMYTQDKYGGLEIFYSKIYLPKTYNFVRLAAIYEAGVYLGYEKRYEKVCIDLLRVNPNDDDVRVAMITKLYNSPYPQDWADADKFAEFFHRDDPTFKHRWDEFQYFHNINLALKTHSLSQAQLAMTDLDQYIAGVNPDTWNYKQLLEYRQRRTAEIDQLSKAPITSGYYLR